MYASGTRFWVSASPAPLSAALICFQDEPDFLQLIFIVLNYTFCGPVWIAVGGFR